MSRRACIYQLRPAQAHDDSRECHAEPCKRSCDPDIEKRAAVGHRRLHPDECPEGPKPNRSRDKIGKCDGNAIPASGKVVSEFMHTEDRKEGERERKPL